MRTHQRHSPKGPTLGLGALAQRLSSRAALLWMVLALALVPALGRLHEVVHAGALQQAHAGHAAPSGLLAVAGHTASKPAHGLFSGMLADHTPVDCLLLDQLALGDALHSPPLVLLPPAPAVAPLAHRAERTGARHVALFHARGPPSRLV